MTSPNEHIARGGSRIESLEPRRLFAISGSLDTSFSGDGKAIVDFGLNFLPAYTIDATDVAVQTDGKTVVAGTWRPLNNAPGPERDFAVVRYNVDGTLDQTFGGGPFGSHKGIVLAHLGAELTDEEAAEAVAIQPDGRIVVAGWTTVDRITFQTVDFAVIRLMPDGSFDNSFDDDGRRTIRLNDLSRANDVFIQDDGKILLAGLTDVGDFPADFDFAVARLNPDGSLDDTFDANGRKSIGLEDTDVANAVAIDAIGKIVLVGESSNRDTGFTSFAAVRLRPDGGLDATFSGDGKQLTGFEDASGEGLGMLMQGLDIIVVGVTRPTGGGAGMAMLRYTEDGRLDRSFGESGTGIVDTPGLASASAVIRSTDGGLVDGGLIDGGGLVVGGNSGGLFALACYSADGVLNRRFGGRGTGIVHTDFDDFAAIAGLARGPGNRFVAAGGGAAATARYLEATARGVSAFTRDSRAVEGTTDTATLVVSRTENLPFPTRVFFSIGGTASISSSRTGARDWSMPGMVITSVLTPTSASGYVDIPANATSIALTFTPINDSLAEPTETASFKIVSNSQYEIVSPSFGTISIPDDETTNILIGTTTVTVPPKQAGVGQELQAAVTWTVPSGGWRQLSTIQLRLRDLHDGDALAVLTFDEASNSFSVESAPAGFGENPVSLVPGKCTFQAAGPTAPTVTAIFTFRLSAAAAQHRFALDVAATNDSDALSSFAQIGELLVHKKPKDDPLFLLL